MLAIVLLLLGGLIGLTVLGVKYLHQRQELARWEFQPPVARITEPLSGSSAPVGSYLSAVAFVTFSPHSPARAVEWYLDGILMESHPLQPAAGVSRAYDSFDLLVPTEGTHMLVARAIDARGVVGLSLPHSFQGVARGPAYYAVAVEAGETLEGLAAGYGSEVSTLQALNPGLDQAPAPGTILKVPIPPDDETPSSLPAPSTPGSGVALVATSPMLKVASIPSARLSLLSVTPPPAPTNLQGEMTNCRVKLLWEDNGENESGYEVWMTAPGAPITRLAELGPSSGGVAWFEFPAPGPGKLLFWVEAINPVGQQPSNTILLEADAACPIGSPTGLQVELLSLAAGAERVYCYLSVEGAPETRLPAQDGDFIATQAGQGDLTPWPHTYTLPIPQDGALDLSGECWGWTGGNLGPLGTFTTGLGRETWDGAPRLAQGSAIEITLAVRYLIPTGTKMTFAERSPDLPSGSFPGFLEETLPTDPTLPIPLITAMAEAAYNPVTAGCNPKCQWLHWTWDGDEAKIRGFAVYLDGQPYAAMFPIPSMRRLLVQPPASACSASSRWQVAAVTASAMSQRSQEFKLPAPAANSQGNCEIYIKVKFESLDLEWTHDGAGSGGPGDCDTMDAAYAIHVDERGPATSGGGLYQTRKFYSSNFTRALSCGNYTHHDLFDAVHPSLVGTNPDYIYPSGVKPPYSEILLYGGLTWPDQPLRILVAANFLDYDPTSDPDWIAKYGTEWIADNFQKAVDGLGCGKTFIDDDEMDSGKSTLQYTITVYPNACERRPEGPP